MPDDITEWLRKTAIKATFASVICAYGNRNPIIALRKAKYYFGAKNIPLVSAMDIPVGRICRSATDNKPAVPKFDAVFFVESTLHNSDVGKRIVIRAADVKSLEVRFYL